MGWWKDASVLVEPVTQTQLSKEEPYLDDSAASLLQVSNLLPDSQRQLEGLSLACDVLPRE